VPPRGLDNSTACQASVSLGPLAAFSQPSCTIQYQCHRPRPRAQAFAATLACHASSSRSGDAVVQFQAAPNDDARNWPFPSPLLRRPSGREGHTPLDRKYTLAWVPRQVQPISLPTQRSQSPLGGGRQRSLELTSTYGPCSEESNEPRTSRPGGRVHNCPCSESLHLTLRHGIGRAEHGMAAAMLRYGRTVVHYWTLVRRQEEVQTLNPASSKAASGSGLLDATQELHIACTTRQRHIPKWLFQVVPAVTETSRSGGSACKLALATTSSGSKSLHEDMRRSWPHGPVCFRQQAASMGIPTVSQAGKYIVLVLRTPSWKRREESSGSSAGTRSASMDSVGAEGMPFSTSLQRPREGNRPQ